MQTRVSTKGRVVLPIALRQRLGIRPGDQLEVALDENRIVLTAPQTKKKYKPRIIKDPKTGFTVLDLGPDAPVLTSEMVREMLADFP
jgi:AbrB family looped-hinge helix DNA binding protein